MYYFISQRQYNFNEQKIQYCTVEESLLYLKQLSVLSVDSETYGLDCHTADIFLLQLGDEKYQYVIDITTIDIILYKELLETKELILQNAKFDIKFFYKYNIIPSKVYDTMLAEQVLYSGLDISYDLGSLVQKYCQITLDKTLQKSISEGVITEQVIYYAAEDIRYLGRIRERQEEEAKKKQCELAVRLENSFVRVLAYTEFCGIYLDQEKWKQKYLGAKVELQKYENLLDQYVIQQGLIKYIDPQMNLFSDEICTSINWNSSQQVGQLFKSLGVSILSDTGGESINKKVLIKQKDRYEIIATFLDYKTVMKDFSTYGEEFLTYVNPVTHRIHSDFFQLVNTSRLSSTNPNMQNIPSDDRTRSCFIAESGNIFIDADYHAQEDLIFVNYSQEEKMIEFYQGEFSDGHSYVAKLCFPEELKNVELKDVKKERPDLRFLAKSAKFAIN